MSGSDDRYRLEPLGDHHNRAAFSCGVAALDRYLRQQAGQDIRRDFSSVYVLNDPTGNLIAGYYTLCSYGISPGQLPAELSRKLPRYPLVPAILLGRLALDSRYQGLGLGKRLLFDALLRAQAHGKAIAAFAIVVDAKDDEARRFYEKYGFERFVDDEHRLFLPIARIAGLTGSNG